MPFNFCKWSIWRGTPPVYFCILALYGLQLPLILTLGKLQNVFEIYLFEQET